MSAARRAAVALAAVALGAVGCSDDGRELRPARPDQTLSIATTSTLPGQVPFQLALTFGEQTPIQDRYTCNAEGVSPPVGWDGVPPEAVELALIVVDVDAGGLVHWLVTGLDPLVPIPDGAIPTDAVQWPNYQGEPRWAPVCPPEGETHRYEFELIALAAPIDATGLTSEQLIERLRAEAVASDVIGSEYP